MPELDAIPGDSAAAADARGVDVGMSPSHPEDGEPTASSPIAADAERPASTSGPADQQGGVPTPSTPLGHALAELNGLDDRDLSEHPDVYERIHTQLHRTLSSIDDA
jgi:hypothetical protein